MEEIWKVCQDNTKYEVSNRGEVRNIETKKVLKAWVINSGYHVVSLYDNGVKTGKLVHRLVANTFIYNNDHSKNIVNHIDNNKLNNNVDNLEWVDYKGNIAHAHKQGRLNTQEARKNLSIVSKKAIYQKDLNGRIIKVWDSPTQASKESGGYFYANALSRVAHGNLQSHRGFLWEYVDKGSIRSTNTCIDVYSTEGTLLHEGYTINKIMKLLGMNNHKTLRDKLRKTEDFVEYNGYKFRNSKK